MPGLAGEVANLIVALKLDDSGFTGRLNAAARQLKGMDAGLSQMGKGVGQVGTGLNKLATVATAATVGGLTAVITTASSMEEAFTGVQKTVDASDAQFIELQDTLRAMSSQTGTAFEELARIGEIGGALGVGVDDLEAFIDVVNRLAVSTDLSVESASTALGQLRTVLDLDDTELRGLADTLVALGNAGASTEPQIVDLAARFAIAGDRAGLSTEEILALSSAVTSMGVEVEAGGTALSKTFNDIAVAIGTGGEEVEGFTSLLGITAEQFRERWEEDALGTFQDWLRELSALDPIAQAVALEMAGITGARQQAAIGAIASNWEFVGEQLEIARDAEGALNEESDKFFATSAAGFRRLKENLRLTAATIGTELLPVTNELISEFVGWLQEEDVQRGIKTFAEDLADGVRGFVEEARKIDWGPILSGLEFAGTVAKGVLDLFKSLPAPLQGLIVGGIALNKISGGAISDILKGAGNIAVGGAKTLLGSRGATPANPVFVKEVGLGGRGGGPTGGGRGGGKLPLLTGALGGAAFVATTLTSSENPNAMLENERIGLQKKVNDGLLTMAQAADVWTDKFGATEANPFITAAADMAASFDRAMLQRQGERDIERQSAEAESFDQAMLQRVIDEVSGLPDTAMMQPLITAATSHLPSLPPIVTEQQRLRDMQSQALAAARGTTAEVSRLASTPHNVNVAFAATIPVSVSATVLANQLYRQQYTRSSTFTQSTNTGGV